MIYSTLSTKTTQGQVLNVGYRTLAPLAPSHLRTPRISRTPRTLGYRCYISDTE
jgi:hypothetical protein